jgi:uncharacterized protein YbjQ (UPF0145 family)
MIECPKCGFINDEGAINCSSCRVNLQWALENPDQFASDEEARRLREEMDKRLSNFIVTTTFNIEGKRISNYIGVFTSEVVLGTGLLSEFGAGIADLLGTRAGGFQYKLRQAKEEALDEVKRQSVIKGADAIVGLDIDYSTLTSNLLMVVASGTAVKLEPES